MSQNKKSGKFAGFGSAMLRYIIGIVVAMVIFYLFSEGGNLLRQNNNSQRKAEISLNDYIDQGKAFPEKEYVSLNVRWVIGPYATETTTSTYGSRYSDGGLTATTGVNYFYYVVLEDMTLLTVKTANNAEVETLDRMSEWLLNVDGFPMNGETFTLQGKLEEMTQADLLKEYKANLSIFGLTENDPEVRYLVLDTTEGREGLYIGIVIVVAAVIIALVIRSRGKKKKAQESAEALKAQQEQFAFEQAIAQQAQQTVAAQPQQPQQNQNFQSFDQQQ